MEAKAWRLVDYKSATFVSSLSLFEEPSGFLQPAESEHFLEVKCGRGGNGNSPYTVEAPRRTTSRQKRIIVFLRDSVLQW